MKYCPEKARCLFVGGSRDGITELMELTPVFNNVVSRHIEIEDLACKIDPVAEEFRVVESYRLERLTAGNRVEILYVLDSLPIEAVLFRLVAGYHELNIREKNDEGWRDIVAVLLPIVEQAAVPDWHDYDKVQSTLHEARAKLK